MCKCCVREGQKIKCFGKLGQDQSDFCYFFVFVFNEKKHELKTLYVALMISIFAIFFFGGGMGSPHSKDHG